MYFLMGHIFFNRTYFKYNVQLKKDLSINLLLPSIYNEVDDLFIGSIGKGLTSYSIAKVALKL